MKVETIEFDFEETKYRGELIYPKKTQQRMHLLIILHGLTGNMHEAHINELTMAAINEEYVVLRVNQYGHGNSDGLFFNHDINKWVKYGARIVEISFNWDFVLDIVLAGHSQGGLTAMLIGGLLKDKIKAMMLLSPAMNIVSGAQNGNLLGVSFNPQKLPDKITIKNGLDISSNYLMVARSLPVESAIKSFDKPVFIVQGTSDNTVSVEISKNLKEKYSNATIALIDKAGHCYENHLDEFNTIVLSFLNQIKWY